MKMQVKCFAVTVTVVFLLATEVNRTLEIIFRQLSTRGEKELQFCCFSRKQHKQKFLLMLPFHVTLHNCTLQTAGLMCTCLMSRDLISTVTVCLVSHAYLYSALNIIVLVSIYSVRD